MVTTGKVVGGSLALRSGFGFIKRKEPKAPGNKDEVELDFGAQIHL